MSVRCSGWFSNKNPTLRNLIFENNNKMKIEETKLLVSEKKGDDSTKKNDFNFKVIMMGDINVGKSSIIDAFINE